MRTRLCERRSKVVVQRAAEEYGKDARGLCNLCKAKKVKAELMWVEGYRLPTWVIERASLEAYFNRVPKAKMEEVDV